MAGDRNSKRKDSSTGASSQDDARTHAGSGEQGQKQSQKQSQKRPGKRVAKNSQRSSQGNIPKEGKKQGTPNH